MFAGSLRWKEMVDDPISRSRSETATDGALSVKTQGTCRLLPSKTMSTHTAPSKAVHYQRQEHRCQNMI